MTVAVIKPSFSSGEVAPGIWGRTDLAKFQTGCSVLRNMFVNYRGGVASRAGLAWVGPCKQAGTSDTPPRIIPFRFNVTQSMALEFGDQYMRIIQNGSYTTEAHLNISAITQANPAAATVVGHTYVAGDLVFVSGVNGMTQMNNRYFLVRSVSGSTVFLNDIFGNAVNSTGYTAYISGGTMARIYTVVSPYAAVDLPYLKFTQSADVMSLTCVNQLTLTEYPPYDLARNGPTNWTFTQVSFTSVIAAPTNCAATASTTAPIAGGQQNPNQYAYCVTAVDAKTGSESIASNIAYVLNSVDIGITLGSITITWTPVTGAAYYKVYKAPTSYNAPVPVGSVFGYIATSYGATFTDTNVVADLLTVPPLRFNPFARGRILSLTKTGSGTGYTQATVGYTINTTTGSGAVLAPVVLSGDVVAFIVQTGGSKYAATDTITVTDSGSGAGATFSLTVGPQTGTYPSVVSYFQSRRVYANTLNNPDTYFMSQTGAYLDFDSATPPIDSDAITGTPWAQQVNGIQWLQPMPGGLIVATGLDTWQLAGSGGTNSAFTPASQSAQAQESNGFSPTVPPIKINYNIIYVQSLGTVVRDLQYNVFVNIYAGVDISFLSNHLFEGFQLVQWGWAKEPYKVIWAVRNDGNVLSLTYLKEQEICGWARHDTNGLFKSVTTISEPPVDAVYFVVKRYISAAQKWMYYIERMDNRLWNGPEDPFCVDAGLSLPQPAPNATLYASNAGGSSQIANPFVITGGSNYTSPTAIVIDPTGSGTGAQISLTVSGGVITGATVVTAGANYKSYEVKISDSTGSGAAVGLQLIQPVTFTASSAVFSSGNVGSVIRMGGGIATITGYTSSTVVTAQFTQPISEIIPNDPNNLPSPALSGTWTITAPVTNITNLDHLNGMVVSILADGSVQTPQTVTNGTITLANAASSVNVGLPFVAQIQSLHLDSPGGATIQGKRKRVSGVTVRMEKSRGLQVGANQPVASALNFQPEVQWSYLSEIKDRTSNINAGNAIPLYTGDKFIPIEDDWWTDEGDAQPGFIAAQQLNPLPMNILAFVPEAEVGDSNG